jgi:hypothetical protein
MSDDGLEKIMKDKGEWIMSSRNEYEFADLHSEPGLVEEIVQLENRLSRQLGQNVTLIAYTRTDGNDDSCRAKPNE